MLQYQTDQSFSATDNKLTDHHVRGISSFLLRQVVESLAASRLPTGNLRRSPSWGRCLCRRLVGLLIGAFVGLVAGLAIVEAGDHGCSSVSPRSELLWAAVASSLLLEARVPPSQELAAASTEATAKLAGSRTEVPPQQVALSTPRPLDRPVARVMISPSSCSSSDLHALISQSLER